MSPKITKRVCGGAGLNPKPCWEFLCHPIEDSQQKYTPINEPQQLGHNLVFMFGDPGIFLRKRMPSFYCGLIILELKLIDLQMVLSCKSRVD